MIGRNDSCWCGSGKKWKKCHFPHEKTGSTPQNIRELYKKKYGILLKTPPQIEGIRAASHLAASILTQVAERAKEGVTTEELNTFAEELHKKAGAKAAPFHYGDPPFPKSICTSLNEVICHGIPDHIPLKKGDILNIDVTSILNGYYGDCSQMVVVGGETTPEKQLVVDVAYECLMRAVRILKPGIPINQIGEEIESYAHSKGCSVVNQFVAHGVGVHFHENPQIPHNRNSLGVLLAPGMTFTIEPMINAGTREAVIDPVDQWTARTADGKASAQWEHTLLITEEGYEVLTPWKNVSRSA